MEQPEKEIIHQFDKLAGDAPLSLYALAARRRWKKEMKVAAKASLSIPFKAGTWVPEMKDMDAETYMRLHAYHDACAEAAASVILSHGGPSNYYTCSAVTEKHGVWFLCTHDGATQHVTEKLHVDNLQKDYRVSYWFIQYLKVLQDLVRQRPRGDTLKKQRLLRVHAGSYIHLAMNRCAMCSDRVLPELERLRENLCRNVDRAIAEVSAVLCRVFV